MLKEKHPHALITIEDLAAVVEMTNTENAEPEGDIKWLDSGEESETYAVETMDDECLTHLTLDDTIALESTLSNISYLHGGTYNDTMIEALLTMSDQISKKTSGFKGVVIDTAANRKPVMCSSQHKEYELEFGVTIPLRPPTREKMKGIGGEGRIIGDATIPITFPKLDLIIDVDFLIIEGYCPSLIINKDMTISGLDISIQGGFLHVGGKKQPLTLDNYFFIHKWGMKCLPYVLYTNDELQKIHKGFGHPSVKSMYNLLKRASGSNLRGSLKKELDKIVEECNICRSDPGKPRRFKLTTGTEELMFNHIVTVDTMFIEGRPVLHLVDESTHYLAACFLKSQSTDDI